MNTYLNPPAPARIYVSGPMSGKPNYNYEAFHEATDKWREAGHVVENPAEHFNGRQDLGYEEYLRRDVQAVFECTHVAVLDGWQDSKGARMEVHLGVVLGKTIINGEKVVTDLKDAELVLVDDHGAPPTGNRSPGWEAMPLTVPLFDYDEQRARRQALTRVHDYSKPPVRDFEGLVDGGGYKTSMDDSGKLPLWLVPNALVNAAARALQHGAKKYAPNNWRRGMAYSEVFSALQRHLTAWNEGEDTDPDSGLNHLDHAAACLSFLAEYVEQPQLYASFDSRFKRPSA